MNILITSAGRRVSLVRAFQKELGRIDSKARIMASDSNPLLAPACHVAHQSIGVPRLDQNNYMDVLLQRCLENNIKLIVPTIDTELPLLAQNRSLLEENHIKVVVGSIDLIEKCRDKRATHRFFTSKGIAVAKEYDRENYRVPMFLKPYDGSHSRQTYCIKSRNDLCESFFSNEKLMFLEYLDRNDYQEYTCDLYYARDHTLKCAVPRKRLEVREGEVSKACTHNNKLVPYIKKHLSHINGAIGCLTVQFFIHRTGHSIYGIEINPRFGGGFPLSYRAGANYPKWIIEEYLMGKEIPESFDCWEDNLLMVRYDDEILIHGYKDR